MKTEETNDLLKDFYTQMATFQVAKNTAYDNAWTKRGRLVPGGNALDGLWYRLEEKLERLEAQLKKPKSQDPNEGIQDTIKDIIGTLALAYIALHRQTIYGKIEPTSREVELTKLSPSFAKTPCSGSVKFEAPVPAPCGIIEMHNRDKQ